MRSVIIANYKKNTGGAYHRLNRNDWTAAQRERRDAFNDASLAEYFTPPKITEGTVHLIIGDSLFRVLTRIQAHWKVGILSFSGAARPQMLASLELLEMGKVYTVTLMMGTNDVSRGESRKMVRLQDKVSCILEELRVYLDLTVLTICTVPFNMMADQNAMSMIERVRHINEIIMQVQQRGVLPVKLLDLGRRMQDSLPQNSSSDGNHFDKPKGTECLNGVFQRHINFLESDLVEKGQFTYVPPPRPSFFPVRPVADRLGRRVNSRGSSRSSRSRQLGSTSRERDEMDSLTPQSSAVSSVVVLDNKKARSPVGGPGGASKPRYLERVKDLDLEDLACRQELMEVLGLKSLTHEDLSDHYSVICFKALEAHFSRDKNPGDGGLDWDSQEVNPGASQLQAIQGVGKPSPHRGTSKAANKYIQDQSGDS